MVMSTSHGNPHQRSVIRLPEDSTSPLRSRRGARRHLAGAQSRRDDRDETIQITAGAARKAAAQARQFWLVRAAERLDLADDELSICQTSGPASASHTLRSIIVSLR